MMNCLEVLRRNIRLAWGILFRFGGGILVRISRWAGMTRLSYRVIGCERRIDKNMELTRQYFFDSYSRGPAFKTISAHRTIQARLTQHDRMKQQLDEIKRKQAELDRDAVISQCNGFIQSLAEQELVLDYLTVPDDPHWKSVSFKEVPCKDGVKIMAVQREEKLILLDEDMLLRSGDGLLLLGFPVTV